MLRTVLLASILLTGSGTALAHGDYGYGRVVTVEPHFVISFGTRHHDGFSVLYESGGHRYSAYTPYHPGRTIVLPAHHRIQYGHAYRDSRDGRNYRRDRNVRHENRHEARHDARRHYRDHRRHDRD